MKKTLCLFLALIMVFSLAACKNNGQGSNTTTQEPGSTAQGSDVAGQPADMDFEWTRQGFFIDENNTLAIISPSVDVDNPGWYVAVYVGESNRNGYLQQEGKTLHGSITDSETNEAAVLTVSEEGEDGVLLEVEGGETYHLVYRELEEASIAVRINTDGMGAGQIAYAKEGEGEPVFDDEFPSQSAYVGLKEPETYVLAAKPDEGSKVLGWTKDGVEFSKEPVVTVEFTESAEYKAVFGIAGTNEAHVDLDAVKTLGELLGLPNYGTAAKDEKYVYAFEQDGVFYQAFAEMPEDVGNSVSSLDFDDEQYDEKLRALISPLVVTKINNITEAIPKPEELDALAGRTVEELLNDGWSCSGWNLEDMYLNMSHTFFSYEVYFSGDVDRNNFDEEDIAPLKVESVKYAGFRDMTYFDEAES